jgi:hypothetical protein
MSQTSVEKPRHSRKGLYIPFILVGIGLALWTGWWFYLTHEVQSQLRTRLAQLEASGWTVSYDRMGASGWPAHARISLQNLEVVAPSGHGLRSPEIAAEATSYNPTRWVIGAQQGLTLLRAEKGETAVSGEAIRMSLTGLRQRWPNVAMEMVAPVFVPAEGAQPFPLSSAKLIQLYMRPHVGASVDPATATEPATAASPTTSTTTTSGTQDDVDIMFRLVEAKGRVGGPVEGFAQSGELTLQVEAVIEKAGALRQPATEAGLLAAWTASGGKFTTVRGEMRAGISHALLTSPELTASEKGQLEGEVHFKAEKPLAAIVGLAGAQSGTPVDRAAAARAAAAGPQGGQGEDGQDIELSVLFRNGRTYLGPFALAPAPQLF